MTLFNVEALVESRYGEDDGSRPRVISTMMEETILMLRVLQPVILFLWCVILFSVIL